MAYGDSYSAVQSAELQQEAMRRAGLSEAMNRMLGTAQNIQSNRFNERNFANAMQQQKLINEFNRRREMQANEAIKYNKERDIQGDKIAATERGYRMTQDAISNLLRGRQINAMSQRNAPPPPSDLQFEEAWEAITTGMISDPNQIDTLYPNILPQEKVRLKTYAQTLQKEIDQEDEFAQGTADDLNAQLEIMRRSNFVKALKKQQQDRAGEVFTRASTAEKEFAPKIQQAETYPYDKLPPLDSPTLSDFVTRSMKDKRVASTTRFDPKTQRFVPYLRSSRKASTGASAPATGSQSNQIQYKVITDPNGNQMTEVVSPNGVVGTIRVERLKDYLENGYTVAP